MNLGNTATVTINQVRRNPFVIGDFVKVKKQRKVKGLVLIVADAWDDNGQFSCTLKPPIPQKKKNGYMADRLRGIYKHKPRKSYYQ